MLTEGILILIGLVLLSFIIYKLLIIERAITEINSTTDRILYFVRRNHFSTDGKIENLLDFNRSRFDKILSNEKCGDNNI